MRKQYKQCSKAVSLTSIIVDISYIDILIMYNCKMNSEESSISEQTASYKVCGFFAGITCIIL